MFVRKVMCLSFTHLHFTPFKQRCAESTLVSRQLISRSAPVACQLPLSPHGSVISEKARVSDMDRQKED